LFVFIGTHDCYRNFVFATKAPKRQVSRNASLPHKATIVLPAFTRICSTDGKKKVIQPQINLLTKTPLKADIPPTKPPIIAVKASRYPQPGKVNMCATRVANI